MVTKKKKNPKKRRPKGKSLTEKLAEKDAALPGDDDPELDDGERDEDEDDDDWDEDDDAPDDEDDDDDEDDEDDDGPEDDDEDASPSSRGEDGEYEDEDDEDDDAAGQMGHRRYVIAGFFGLWLIVGYISGQALIMLWSKLETNDDFSTTFPSLLAIPHDGDLISRESISLVLGAILGGLIVYRYYVKPSVRTWADEVAEQLQKVRWPTRKEVGNNTVVVIAASAVITVYLSLLDTFWKYLSNLIYSSS